MDTPQIKRGRPKGPRRGSNPASTEQTGITLPVRDMRAVEMVASQAGVSKNEILRRAVSRYLAENNSYQFIDGANTSA